MKCCVCNSVRVARLGKVGAKPGAVTSDSALIQHPVIVWRCTDCGHLQKLHTDDDWRVIGGIYNDYAGHRLSSGREQLVFPPGLPPRPRSYHALEQCRPKLPARGVLLDYGAGDGAVLKSAGKLLPDWQFQALDITNKFRDEILRLPGVVGFTSGDPAQLPRAHFDLIVVWHTLEHVPQPSNMLRTFHQWLKPDGQVLIQVPDVARNPYDLGVVDHVSHFTNATLRFCARRAGFEIATDGHPWAHNCLTFLLGSPEVVPEAAPEPRTGVAAGNPFEWLNAQIQFFVAQVGTGSYSIFGTGMASLLLSTQLPITPQFFLDEDDRRVGSKINGIPIVHPRELRATTPIVMPFLAETSRAIALRLAAQCPGLKPEQFLYAD